jgi:hypothetical protein
LISIRLWPIWQAIFGLNRSFSLLSGSRGCEIAQGTAEAMHMIIS